MGRGPSIEARKNASDAKRGKIFTKIIREIGVAARGGGGDPNNNPRLRVAMDKGLAVMDVAAVALARENSIPIIVFSIHEKGGFGEILSGGGRKTIVSDN